MKKIILAVVAAVALGGFAATAQAFPYRPYGYRAYYGPAYRPYRPIYRSGYGYPYGVGYGVGYGASYGVGAGVMGYPAYGYYPAYTYGPGYSPYGYRAWGY